MEDGGNSNDGAPRGQGANIPDPEINNYDIDDDFPEYANEQNKELNQIVSPLESKVVGERKGKTSALVEH